MPWKMSPKDKFAMTEIMRRRRRCQRGLSTKSFEQDSSGGVFGFREIEQPCEGRREVDDMNVGEFLSSANAGSVENHERANRGLLRIGAMIAVSLCFG